MLKEKIEEIKQRLSLSDKELSLLLDVNMQTLINCKEKETIIGKLTNIISITEKDLETTHLPNLTIRKSLNRKKYNKFMLYNTVIKSHYTNKWTIYVLTKTKVKEKFSIKSFFKKNNTSITLKEFTPSFLALTKNTKLLINFEYNDVIITELDYNTNIDLFILNNVRYKKANEVKI